MHNPNYSSCSNIRKRVPRTFAFDKKIPLEEYGKYISEEDLLNESFE